MVITHSDATVPELSLCYPRKAIGHVLADVYLKRGLTLCLVIA